MFFDDKNFLEEEETAQDFIFSGISVEVIKGIRFNVQTEENTENSHIAEELKEFQKLLDEMPDNEQQDLEKLICNLCTFTPKTFGGYLALLQTFTVLAIVRNPPISYSFKIAQLRGHISGIPTDEWVDDPIKVHLAVERILSGLRSVNCPDLLNIYHLSQQLWGINDFLFYVTLSLTWVAFHRALGRETIIKQAHRPHDVKHLLTELKKIEVLNYKDDLLKFFILLKILTLIINMSLPKAPWRIIPFSYEMILGEITEEQINELMEWFKNAQQILRINLCQTMAQMKIREVLDYEIFTTLNHRLMESSMF